MTCRQAQASGEIKVNDRRHGWDEEASSTSGAQRGREQVNESGRVHGVGIRRAHGESTARACIPRQRRS
jgi:hypothetical protein